MIKPLVNFILIFRRHFVSSFQEEFRTNLSNKKCNKMRDNHNIIHLNDKNLTSSIEKAVRCLQNGEVIAIPTDTIYGLACLAQNTKSIEKLYEIKSRQTNKPISISVGCVDDIYKWVNVSVPEKLLNDLLPGPVTVVFERSPNLNPFLNPQTQLVGVRVPQDKFVLELCKRCCGPIALTSANVSSQDSALTIEEFSSIWSSIDKIFDGGPITVNNCDKSGSTVVDLSKKNFYSIIRSGCAEKNTIYKLEKHKLNPLISPLLH